jgi:hypothetical protein
MPQDAIFVLTVISEERRPRLEMGNCLRWTRLRSVHPPFHERTGGAVLLMRIAEATSRCSASL